MKETLQQLEQRAAAEVRDRAEQDLANRLLAIGDAAAPSRQRRALQAVALVTVLAVVGGMLAVQLRSDDLVVTADDPTTGIDEPSDPTPTTSIPDGTPCSEAELATGRRWPLDESEEEIEIDPVVFSEAQRAQVVEAFQSSSDPDLSNLVEEPLEDAGGGDPEIERALNLQLIPGPNTDSKVSVFAYRTVGQLCETAGSMAEGDSSWDAVLRQARANGNTDVQEACALLAHGMLHLAGHDHPDDAAQAEMDRLTRLMCADAGIKVENFGH